MANVTVITIDPEEVVYGSADVCYELIESTKPPAMLGRIV